MLDQNTSILTNTLIGILFIGDFLPHFQIGTYRVETEVFLQSQKEVSFNVCGGQNNGVPKMARP